MNERVRTVIINIINNLYYSNPSRDQIIALLRSDYSDLVKGISDNDLSQFISEARKSTDAKYLQFKREIHRRYFGEWFRKNVCRKDELQEILDAAREKGIDRDRLIHEIFLLLQHKNFLPAKCRKFPDKQNEEVLIQSDWGIFLPESEIDTTLSDGSSIEKNEIGTTRDNNGQVIASTIVVEHKERRYYQRKLALGIVVLMSFGLLSYFFYFQHKWLVDKSPRFYAVADNTSFLLSPGDDVAYNKISTLSRNAELVTFDSGAEWCYVEVKGKKGYVATKAVLNKKDYSLLNSIFGDGRSNEAISEARCRKALLKYFKDKNYIGKISIQSQVEIFGSYDATKEIWQVFTRGESAVPNSFLVEKIVDEGSLYDDFAVILKSASSGKRKLVIFTFGYDEVPIVVDEQYAPRFGNIISVSKTSLAGKIKYVVKYSEQ